MPTGQAPMAALRFRDVLAFVAGYWRRQPVRIGIVLAMLIAAALLEANLPNMLAELLASIRTQQSHDRILACLFWFIGNYLAVTVLNGTSLLIYNVFEAKIFKLVLDDAFEHVQRLSERFSINTFAGSIISKISRGRSQLETFQDQFTLNILPTLVVLAGSIAFLGRRYPTLALLLFIYVLMLMLVSWIMVTRFAGPAQALSAKAQDSFNASLADGIAGLSTTKSFAQEQHEIARMHEATWEFTFRSMRSYISQNTASLIQRFMLAGMLAVLLGGGAWYLFHGQASIENMAYLALASTILQNYVGNFGDFVRRMLTASYDLHGVINLMREPEEVADPAGAAPLNVTAGAIAFDNVTFTYPGKQTPVFAGLSLTIRAGERIAVVGHSGGGKTSFVRLLQRLYDVQSGRILIDGQDIAGGTQRSLRQAIALVPQDPILFHRSLRDNIAYGKPEASLDDVRIAARQAHIDEFIMGLPEQYETLVGERGIKLSGGERQRVAMARAILADRPILILDEATSSLDSASERAIQEALKSLTHGRTSIMIAHRLSTILDADRIVVFEKGRIVEEGTHGELLDRNGIYAGFFNLQSGGFIGEDAG